MTLVLETKDVLLKYIVYERRMSQEQQIAVGWMTAPRSALLGPYRGTALQAAVVTTAVPLTPTHPSSTNLRRVRFCLRFNM